MLRSFLSLRPSVLQRNFSTTVLEMQARSPASAALAGPPSKRKRSAKKPTTSGASTPRFMSTTVAAPIAATMVNQVPVDSELPAGRGFTEIRFSDFLRSGAISQSTANGIKHEFCTPVQAETLPVILSGVDVLAQAKTGTGKTVAFLVPAIERLVRSSPAPPMGQISILILSPTRELAIQIEEEARILLSGTIFKTMSVVGGTNMKSETNRLNKERCDILVGTPGRMIDHLENSNVKAKLANVRIVILDEADRLLEQGFRRELTKILDHLPDRKKVSRQTLLFSATVPAQVHQIASLALLPNFTFVSTISEEDTNTHEHVPQHSLIAPLNDIYPLTLATIRHEIATHGAATKIMIFLPTARATGLAAAVLQKVGLGLEVTEIHSRKSQSARNAAAEAFRVAKSGVLCSSDVTARGMDFPGVTTVLQVGLPANAEQYIHRLGRTARAGASGCGILILTPFENFFLRKREIVALSITEHPETHGALTKLMGASRAEVRDAMGDVDDEIKSQYYGASLGFYKPFIKDTFGDAGRMVATMNDYATSIDGLAFERASGEIPGMLASTIGKMGLRGTPGLNIVHALPPKAGGGAPGGGRGGGGGGGRGGGGGARGGGGGGRGGARGGRGRGM